MRINPFTGKEEFWNQPTGLTGIWMTPEYCDRCKQFNGFLGLSVLSDTERGELENSICDALDRAEIYGKIAGKWFGRS
jgi:hypothetical protein